MIEEILSLSSCLATELNGVRGAVVIACEAGEAHSVVQPCGRMARLDCDVVDGANLGTRATFEASVLHHVKRFVGDKIFHEYAPDES